MPFRTPSTRRGSALVEFALVAPVFLALALGVMDWSWTMFAQHTVVSRAARAARWAAARPFEQATVDGARNIVLCGASACVGNGGFLDMTAANIAVDQTTATQTVANGVPATTALLEVRVSGYRIFHFAPLNQSALQGRTVVAACATQCVDWECGAQ